MIGGALRRARAFAPVLIALVFLSSPFLSAAAAPPPSAPGPLPIPYPIHGPDMSPDQFIELPPDPMIPLVTAEFAVAAIMIANLIEARKGSNEAAAIGGLRSIETAQGLYREGDKDGNGMMDYATSLDQLAAQGLIDDALGMGMMQGYSFGLEAVDDPLSQFRAIASPLIRGTTGDGTFYIDETGILLVENPCEEGGGEPSPQGVGTSPSPCVLAEEEARALSIGSLSALDIMSDGAAVEGAIGVLIGMGDEVTGGILIGLDTDGDGVISFQNLLEDPAVLDARFAGMMEQMSMMRASQTVSPGPPNTQAHAIGSFFDVFTDYSRDMGELLQLGIDGEVVDFTVPLSTLMEGATEDTLALLADVPPLDHFKCYSSQGDAVEELVGLQDQFDVPPNALQRVKVYDPQLFCNPTRKTLPDGTGNGIRNADGHLTGYRIVPVTGAESIPHTVVAINQFGAKQVLTTLQPRFLLVPTQKALVDGADPGAGGGVAEGLDHFKCYDVRAQTSRARSVTLQDQFDVAGQTAANVKVGKALYFCNPTAKFRTDAAGNVVSTGIENPGGHLTCYAIESGRQRHELEVNNQFGDGQKVTTGNAVLLCVPTVKRIPRPNPVVIAGFDLLEAQIAAIPDDLMSMGQRHSFLVKLENAQMWYSEGGLCNADNEMNAFLNEAAALRHHAMAGMPPPDDSTPGITPLSHNRGSDFGGDTTGLAEDIANRGSQIRSGFSDSFFDVFFDVFVEPSRCFVAGIGTAPTLEVMRSDNMAFEATVHFGAPMLQTVMGGGETWTQLSVPGTDTTGGMPGLPAIPVWRGLVAVPEGAEAVFQEPPSPDMPQGQTMRLNLLPVQGEAADATTGDKEGSFDDEFRDAPFAKDDKAYMMDAFLPPDPCTLTPVGKYRDLQMSQVVCAAGQYNPATDELRLFQSLSFEVRFRGGNGTFVTERSLSPFESSPSLYKDAVLNNAVIGKYVSKFDLSRLICWGEELLVLTHPDFRSAADNLSSWKIEKGIATTVIEVGEGTDYETGAEIDDLIEDRYDGCVVRPSYVLLLGDSEYVPPSDTDWDSTMASCGNCGDVTTGSDWGYAVYVQVLFDAFFPDFGVGRMPVDTLAEANTAVDKTIAYESNPPFVDFGAGGPFYTTAGFASVFQCCRMNLDGTPLGGQAGTDERAFVETSEKARDTLLVGGKSVERMYDETVDDGGCTGASCPPSPVQQPYSGITTPNRYYNGALMPVTLRAGSGFAWDANTADITAAFNAGRFLMLHRGHGSTSGWADPGFSTLDLGSLDNGELLPIVYSVNCASGKWDIETDSGGTTESLMERLLTLSGGGMVGGLGDNRNSPTWGNNALTRGFFDATWPSLAPEYGGATSHRRLGDVLNHGKVYMITQVGVAQTAGAVDLEMALGEYFMWHAFGDPTLEMWTSNPHRLILDPFFKLETRGYDFDIAYPVDGAEITAFLVTENGYEAYGRAVVVNGNVTIVPINPGPSPPSSEELVFSASLPNAVSVMLSEDSGEETTGPQSLNAPPAPAQGAAVESELPVSGLTPSDGNLGGAMRPGDLVEAPHAADSVTEQAAPARDLPDAVTSAQGEISQASGMATSAPGSAAAAGTVGGVALAALGAYAALSLTQKIRVAKRGGRRGRHLRKAP